MSRFLTIAAFATVCTLSTAAEAQFRMPWPFSRANNCPGGVCPPQNRSLYSAPGYHRPTANSWQPAAYNSYRPAAQPAYRPDCRNGNCVYPRTQYRPSTRDFDAYSAPYQPARSPAPRYDDWTPTRYEPGYYGSTSSLNIPRGMDGIAQLPAAEQTAALQQRTCPVTGELLGSMGRPIRVNVGRRSVYACCPDCAERLRRYPSRYLPMAQRPGTAEVR